MGVLCMLEGNREKAELYLEMAAAAGVERCKRGAGRAEEQEKPVLNRKNGMRQIHYFKI